MARIVLEPLTKEMQFIMFQHCGINVYCETASSASERICRFRQESSKLRNKILKCKDDKDGKDEKKKLAKRWSFLQSEILLYEGWIRFLLQLSN